MNEALRPVVLAVLVAAILVFDPRAGHAGGRPKYLLVLAGGVTAAALLVAGRARGRPWRDNPLRWALLAFLVAAAVSTLTSDHRSTALYGFPGSYDGFLTTVCFAALFVATVQAFPVDSVAGAVRVLCFGAGAGVVLFGLGQLGDRLLSPDTGWDWARPGISPWTIGSTLGNPNHLGALLAMLLPLSAVLAVRTQGRARLFVLAGVTVAVSELAITASRGAWVAVVAAGAVLAVLFRHQLRPHRRRLVLVAGAGIVLIVVVLAVLGPAGVTKIEPGSLARTGPGSTLDLRFELWSTAWRMAADHPVVGVGPDVFPVVFPAYESDRFMLLYGPFTIANGAHNVFLNSLANLGVAGLASFLALLVAAGTRMARSWRSLDGERRLLAAALAAALAAYLVQACLNTQTVALSLCFWVLLGLLMSVSSAGAEEDDA